MHRTVRTNHLPQAPRVAYTLVQACTSARHSITNYTRRDINYDGKHNITFSSMNSSVILGKVRHLTLTCQDPNEI